MMGRKIEFDQQAADALTTQATAALDEVHQALRNFVVVNSQVEAFLEDAGLDVDRGDYEPNTAPRGLEGLLGVYALMPATDELLSVFPGADLTQDSQDGAVS